MNKKILSLFLVLILIISTFPVTNIYALEERWIDVTIGEIYTANNVFDDDYNSNNNVVRYYVYPDFNYGTNYGFIATFNERYLDNLFPHTSISGQRMKIKVEFNEKISAIAPAQSVVLYQDDIVLGGGIISSSF